MLILSSNGGPNFGQAWQEQHQVAKLCLLLLLNLLNMVWALE